MPNQILYSQDSSKYCDKINNQIEFKNIFSDDYSWLGKSYLNYNEVMYGKFELPTL